MKKKLFVVFYIAAAVLIILFAVFTVAAYLGYKELASNPLVLVAPFSRIAKRLALIFLLPAVICAVIGFILQRRGKSD